VDQLRLWAAAGREAADAAAELDDRAYAALWLGSSNGSLQPHESLPAAPPARVASGIVNVGTDRPRRYLDDLDASGPAVPAGRLRGLELPGRGRAVACAIMATGLGADYDGWWDW